MSTREVKTVNVVTSSLRGKWAKKINHVVNYGDYATGSIVTKHGIVSVYTQGDIGVQRVTHLDFVTRCTFYRKILTGRRFSLVALSMIADKFARECVKGEWDKKNENHRHV